MHLELNPYEVQVGIPSRELLLSVHAHGELQLVSAAGHGGLASIFALRAAYLQVLPCPMPLFMLSVA